MAYYINTRTSEGVETVDEFNTFKEARKMCAEYNMSDWQHSYYVSTRSTKAWRD